MRRVRATPRGEAEFRGEWKPVDGLARDEMIQVHHAPAETGRRLCGRTDMPDRPDGRAQPAALAARPAGVARVAVSPARRCRETAAALFPGRRPDPDPRLSGRDFGAHEGRMLADLPDLGPLARAELAQIAPPGGESFAATWARMRPALTGLAAQARRAGPVAVIAHAGTVRAALAFALGDVPAAYAFELAPLSLTRLRSLRRGLVLVIAANAAA
ncbi:MAG: histidine phosphatase family protein [Gemmobacter sp.]